MKTPGVDTRYTYAVARIRVLEARLLNAADLERLLGEEAPTLSGVSEYSKLLELRQSQRQMGEFLQVALQNTYNFIYDLSYEKGLIEPFFKKSDASAWELFSKSWQENLFLSRYVKMAIDLENIKMLFRLKIQGRDKKFTEARLLKDGYINPAIILSLFDKPLDEVYSKKGYFIYDKILKDAVEEYKASGKASITEKACDDFLINYIKQAKYFHFGAEPLVCYVLAKENEVKNLSIIFAGKANGFKDETLRPLLRKSYV